MNFNKSIILSAALINSTISTQSLASVIDTEFKTMHGVFKVNHKTFQNKIWIDGKDGKRYTVARPAYVEKAAPFKDAKTDKDVYKVSVTVGDISRKQKLELMKTFDVNFIPSLDNKAVSFALNAKGKIDFSSITDPRTKKIATAAKVELTPKMLAKKESDARIKKARLIKMDELSKITDIDQRLLVTSAMNDFFARLNGMKIHENPGFFTSAKLINDTFLELCNKNGISSTYDKRTVSVANFYARCILGIFSPQKEFGDTEKSKVSKDLKALVTNLLNSRSYTVFGKYVRSSRSLIMLSAFQNEIWIGS